MAVIELMFFSIHKGSRGVPTPALCCDDAVLISVLGALACVPEIETEVPRTRSSVSCGEECCHDKRVDMM